MTIAPFTDSICGISAYTRAEYSPTGPLGISGAIVSDRRSQTGRAWTQVIDDLLALRNLSDDWDGQGALAPAPALVDGAITLAQDLQAAGRPPADFAVAGVNGTIIFEWHTPAEYLEIEVTAPDKAEVRRLRRGSDVTEVSVLTRR